MIILTYCAGALLVVLFLAVLALAAVMAFTAPRTSEDDV